MTKSAGPLRRGWTTGACATAAAKAAYTALLSGSFPDPVEITLPTGRAASFHLTAHHADDRTATAGILKDAGDDPDITHGVLVSVTVARAEPGSGVTFHAGPGVGTVTKPGLPLPPGEPAINPVPRTMIRQAVEQVAREHGDACDVSVEISIPGGEELALKTMNPRLGIVGGLSILGTTGIVIPYSCAAWIASIHEGIDVARATGITHIAGSTGKTSEASVALFHALPESALIEMGDFVGGMLKYLRLHPLPRLTVAGGFAKIAKLAQGHRDLHSQRSALDMGELARYAKSAELHDTLAAAHTGMHAWELARDAGFPLAEIVASRAREVILGMLRDAPINVDVLVVDRAGTVIGHATSNHP